MTKSPPSMEATVKTLERAFGDFTSDHAVPASDLDAVESRLGVSLPPALRVLYERTGRHPLHTTHDVLIPPEGLGIVDGYLVVYRERQDVTEWAVAVANLLRVDPPVEKRVLDRGKFKFVEEFTTLSQFAAFQAAWQAVQGALPFVGVLASNEHDAAVARVTRDDAVGMGDLVAATAVSDVRISDGSIGYVQSDGYIGLAARTATRFEEVSGLIGIPIDAWDYATMRDETD